METTFDVIVIGAGPAGENVADRAVKGGLTAAIVERELVGGECSYWACMPTKALLRSGAARRAALAVPGVTVTGGLDATAVLRRRDEFAAHWKDDGQVSWLDGAGITLFRGAGRIAGERVVEVDSRWAPPTGAGTAVHTGTALHTGDDREPAAGESGTLAAGADGARPADDDARPAGNGGAVTAGDGAVSTDGGEGTARGIIRLTARHAVVVATGTSALIPDIDGLREAQPWTSREAAAATSVPGRLAIIGGGVVATEMATAFAGLGSAVTVLARGGLLTSFEPFAGERVAESLREAGVDVRLGAEVVRVRRDRDGTVRLTGADGEVISADEVLVATGRRPNTDGLGLPSAGWLPVDDTMRVNDWLYAVGDVNGRALLTHQGKYQARLAGNVIVARATGAPVDDGPWGRHAATADTRAVPQVVFTDPEIAAVGLTAAAAEAAGLRVRVVDYDLGAVAGAALHADGYRGHARMVVDEDRAVVVGVTLAGPDVAELLHAATIAVAGEVPIARLWHAVPAYPTVSEIWLRLLEAL